MTPLLPHQQEFVDRNPDNVILAWGTRVGKTLAMVGWMRKRSDKDILLIFPKRLKKQWSEEIKDMPNVHPFTKEEVLKHDIEPYDVIVVDEAHHVSSSTLPHHKPSRITRKLYNWRRSHPKGHILLATATPIRSNPGNLYTLAVLRGVFWNPTHFRDLFFELVRRPFQPRPFWQERETWRKDIHRYVREVCEILVLSDVTEVPEQRHHVVDVHLAEDTLAHIKAISDEEPMREWYAKHKAAQGKEKLKHIRELSENEAKVIIVCNYIEHIDFLQRELSKEREVIVLSGKTKDQPQAIADAQESTECYFIIQADAGEGFRGDNFSLLIFAGMSRKYLSYEQMLGRMLHLEKKHSNDFYYLLADEKDRAIYEQVMQGKDFSIQTIRDHAH